MKPNENYFFVVQKFKSLELIKFSQPVCGGLYGVRDNKSKTAKNGLCLDTAVDLFNNCIKTKREIKVAANVSKRTFTIRTEFGKYRTTRMSMDDFKSCQHNTGNDWQNFLNRSGDYYKV
jgi:hypothetical protein